jgi:PPP family 3-phenylpropionic acid transporter
MALAALVMSSHALHDGFEVLRWEDGGIGPGAAGLGSPSSLARKCMI